MAKLNANSVELGSLTTAQRDALTGVSNGTVIYNSTDSSIDGYGPTGWTTIKSLNPIGSASNPASSPKAIRDAGITTSGLYYITTGGLGTKQVYLTFDTFGGGSIGGTVAWALVSRFDSYNHSSYNTYGFLDSIETTNFGTNSTKQWWVDQNVVNRGWMNSINYVCYHDETTGYYVTESQSGTIWQTSFIHTTSSGYPNNQMINVNYNSYDNGTQVGCCWCESAGCTEHFDSNGACTGTDVVRFDANSGNSTVSIWVAQI